MYQQPPQLFTYDHRILNPALPVRSAVLKQDTGGLVVKWVTISEYPLLYVFDFLFFFASLGSPLVGDGQGWDGARRAVERFFRVS
jgi:hypothetical protein